MAIPSPFYTNKTHHWVAWDDPEPSCPSGHHPSDALYWSIYVLQAWKWEKNHSLWQKWTYPSWSGNDYTEQSWANEALGDPSTFIPFLVFPSGKWGMQRNGDSFIYQTKCPPSSHLSWLIESDQCFSSASLPRLPAVLLWLSCELCSRGWCWW